MDRSMLSNEQWERIAPLLPGKIGDPGRSGRDNHQFLEAALWIDRTGGPSAISSGHGLYHISVLKH